MNWIFAKKKEPIFVFYFRPKNSHSDGQVHTNTPSNTICLHSFLKTDRIRNEWNYFIEAKKGWLGGSFKRFKIMFSSTKLKSLVSYGLLLWTEFIFFMWKIKRIYENNYGYFTYFQCEISEIYTFFPFLWELTVNFNLSSSNSK